MNLTEKLIGKQLNKTGPADPAFPGIQEVPVVISRAVFSENTTGVVINGRFIISYDEARRIIEGNNEGE